MGVIRYRYNKAKVGGHQVRAYKRSARQPEYLDADWVMALDLDEFLVINVGDGTLSDLFSAMPDGDQILVNWKLFGSSGQKKIFEGYGS